MNASELMVFDLVCLEGNTELDCPVKVEGVVDGEWCHDGDWMESFEPIPITREILEANGFELYLYEHYIHRYDDNPSHYDFKLVVGGVFNDRWYEIRCGMNNVKILYVHELQHALRFCGLRELANNFSVNLNNVSNMKEECNHVDEVVTIDFLKSKGWSKIYRGNGFTEMRRQIDYINPVGKCEKRKQRVTFYEVDGIQKMSIRISYNDFVLEDKTKNLTIKRLVSHLRHAGLDDIASELDS